MAGETRGMEQLGEQRARIAEEEEITEGERAAGG